MHNPLTKCNRYLSAKQLGFLAQNHHALRHKHGITPSFAEDSGFNCRPAIEAHASVESAKNRSLLAVAGDASNEGFVIGEAVLARRRAIGGKSGDGWLDAVLVDGWHAAEVVKARNSRSSGPSYDVR